MPTPVKFAILSTQRTGSTWLTDMLADHPAVEAYTELFLQTGEGYPPWSRRQDFPYWNTWRKDKPALARALGARLKFSYLDELYRLHPQAGAIGFKVMYMQLVLNPAVLAYLRFKKVRLIHLVRENILDIVVSEEALKRRALAHSRGDEPKPRFEVDIDMLLDRLRVKARNLKLARSIIAMLGLPVLEMTYERMREDPGCMQELWTFLNVRKTTAESSLKKGGSDRLRDTIVNYDDLHSALQNTPFEGMLH